MLKQVMIIPFLLLPGRLLFGMEGQSKPTFPEYKWVKYHNPEHPHSILFDQQIISDLADIPLEDQFDIWKRCEADSIPFEQVEATDRIAQLIRNSIGFSLLNAATDSGRVALMRQKLCIFTSNQMANLYRDSPGLYYSNNPRTVIIPNDIEMHHAAQNVAFNFNGFPYFCRLQQKTVTLVALSPNTGKQHDEFILASDAYEGQIEAVSNDRKFFLIKNKLNTEGDFSLTLWNSRADEPIGRSESTTPPHYAAMLKEQKMDWCRFSMSSDAQTIVCAKRVNKGRGVTVCNCTFTPDNSSKSPFLIIPRDNFAIPNFHNFQSIASSPAGAGFFLGNKEGTIRIYDYTEKLMLKEINHGDRIKNLEYIDQDLLLCYGGNTVALYDTTTLNPIFKQRHELTIKVSRFCSPESILLTLHAGLFKLWDVRSNKVIKTIEDTTTILNADFSWDGRFLAGACMNKIHIWSLDNSRKKHEISCNIADGTTASAVDKLLVLGHYAARSTSLPEALRAEYAHLKLEDY